MNLPRLLDTQTDHLNIFMHVITFAHSNTALARQEESAKLLEDKYHRAEAEAEDLQLKRQAAELEKSNYLAQVQAEKRQTAESEKKAKEMEERAKKAAIESERMAREALKYQEEVINLHFHGYIVEPL